MTKTELEYKVKELREHVLGTKLLAYEMLDEVAIIRGLFQQGMLYNEIRPHLTKLDELIEPLMKAVNI